MWIWILLMTHKVHANQNRRRLWGASTASEGHSTLLPWQRRPPSEKLLPLCLSCCVAWFKRGTCLGMRAKTTTPAWHVRTHKHVRRLPPSSSSTSSSSALLSQQGRGRGACSALSRVSFWAFPWEGHTNTHTQASSSGLLENQNKKNQIFLVNPGCVEAKVAGVSPLSAILQYVNRVWIDSVQMD